MIFFLSLFQFSVYKWFECAEDNARIVTPETSDSNRYYGQVSVEGVGERRRLRSESAAGGLRLTDGQHTTAIAQSECRSAAPISSDDGHTKVPQLAFSPGSFQRHGIIQMEVGNGQERRTRP